MRQDARIESSGKDVARYGLAAVIGGIGAEKFTNYKAKDIEHLVLLGTSLLILRASLRLPRESMTPKAPPTKYSV